MTDRSIVYRLEARVDGFKAQMSQAASSVTDAADRMTAADKSGARFRAGLTEVGDVAGRVGLVAAAGLGAAVKASMDWESAWTSVMKTVDETKTTTYAELEEDLRNLARTMPTTHDEIAAVASAAGALGVQTDSVADFTRTMVMLGESTDDLSADQAATSIAQMANVMGTAPKDVERLGAALVALGNNGASTEGQIIQMAQRISGAGAQIGLAESEVLSIANAVASAGIEVEAGGSAISRVFTELAKASASGGPKLQGFADVAGVAADEFARMFEESPAEAFAAFTQGLDGINKSGGDVFSTLKSLGMSDIRVSDALLRMAASGDMLTDSLAQGKQAWEDNTALTEEFGKRADTTASQVQISWNNIKDAAIDAGATLLPVVESAAGAVATLAGAFQSLPGPVKGAAGELLGITALLGGGVWAGSKVVNGIASMRGALGDLGLTGERASRGIGRASGAIGGLTKAAAATGAVVGLVAIADAIDRLGDAELSVGLEAVTGQLRGLAAGETNALAKDFDNLGESIARIGSEKGGLNSLNDALAGAVGMGYGQAYREATAEIGLLDEALAGLVSSDGIPAAEEAFLALAEAQGLSAREQSELANLMPQWRDAIAGAQNETSAAADATKALGDAMGTAAPMTKEQADALADARDEAAKTAGSFFNLGDSLNDASVSLGDWIGEMEAQAQALRDFRRNAQEAADKGLRGGLIRALQEAGPEGARRMEQLASATKEQIARANQAWKSGQTEIDKYVDSTTKVPKNKSTSVEVKGAAAASAQVGALVGQLNAVPPRVQSTIDIVTNRVTNFFKRVMPGTQEADGGVLDFFADGGMRENHVAQIAPAGAWRVWAEPETGGEAYIPLAASKRDRSIDIWEEVGQRLGVQFQRFADGGTTDGKSKKKPRLSLEQYEDPNVVRRLESLGRVLAEQEDRLRRTMEAHGETVDRNTRSVETATAKQDAVLAKMEQAGTGSVAGFNTGLFDRDSNIWGAGAGGGWLANLSRDIAGLTERGNLQSQLAAAGLTGDALAAVLGQGFNADLTALVASGRAAELQSLFNTRASLSASVSAAAGQYAYGAEMAVVSAEVIVLQAQLSESNATLQTMSRQLEILTAKQEQVAATSGTAMAGALNSTARNAQRIRQHNAKKGKGR